jgi:hypothetical protein
VAKVLLAAMAWRLIFRPQNKQQEAVVVLLLLAAMAH